MELGEKVTEVESQNFTVSLNLIKKFLESEFIKCFLYIGRAEDKDAHDKILETLQQVRFASNQQLIIIRPICTLRGFFAWFFRFFRFGGNLLYV